MVLGQKCKPVDNHPKTECMSIYGRLPIDFNGNYTQEALNITESDNIFAYTKAPGNLQECIPKHFSLACNSCHFDRVYMTKLAHTKFSDSILIYQLM